MLVWQEQLGYIIHVEYTLQGQDSLYAPAYTACTATCIIASSITATHAVGITATMLRRIRSVASSDIHTSSLAARYE